MTYREHFDTVIIGAGSAGAVIAARMTERSSNQVLLLEAGPDYPPGATLPAELVDGKRNAKRTHDWGYTHRPNARQMRFPLPRGRVVGGSSAVNTCIALRGMPSDYDEWAALGLPAWNFASCLPAFKRLEHDLDVDDEWHGQDGPIPVRRHPDAELVPWQAAFYEACEALGMERTRDHNAPDASGYGPHAMNKVDGKRMNAALCYLTENVRARSNLTLRSGTLVRRILVENRCVVGLETEMEGRIARLSARRVVVSAGAINTPGILYRSGIGPRAAVERLGIDSICDLPAVAARLLDHPGAAFFLRAKRGIASPRDPIIQTCLRLDSGLVPHKNDITLQPGSFTPLFGVDTSFVSMMCSVGKPRGHGRIEIISADPHAPPRIRSGLLDDEQDRAIAVRALQLALECVRQPAMRSLATVFWPSERVVADEARLSRRIPLLCDSGYHPSGTVPMGRDGSPDAALDQHGRVRGIKNLYVADASIMPTIPTSNINFPTLMIGERFGEWLRDGVI